jgi:hypothetical protein
MKLPQVLTTVTPLSKYLAFLLFIVLPILAFISGIRYQEGMQNTKQILQKAEVVKTTPQKESLPQIEKLIMYPTYRTHTNQVTQGESIEYRLTESDIVRNYLPDTLYKVLDSIPLSRLQTIRCTRVLVEKDKYKLIKNNKVSAELTDPVFIESIKALGKVQSVEICQVENGEMLVAAMYDTGNPFVLNAKFQMINSASNVIHIADLGTDYGNCSIAQVTTSGEFYLLCKTGHAASSTTTLVRGNLNTNQSTSVLGKCSMHHDISSEVSGHGMTSINCE